MSSNKIIETMIIGIISKELKDEIRIDRHIKLAKNIMVELQQFDVLNQCEQLVCPRCKSEHVYQHVNKQIMYCPGCSVSWAKTPQTALRSDWNSTTKYDMKTELDNSTNDELKNVSQPVIKPVLGEVFSLERAKTLAIIKKCKIRHRFYTNDEFIEYKNSEWVTEGGHVLPKGYFESMSGEWLHGWSVH